MIWTLVIAASFSSAMADCDSNYSTCQTDCNANDTGQELDICMAGCSNDQTNCQNAGQNPGKNLNVGVPMA